MRRALLKYEGISLEQVPLLSPRNLRVRATGTNQPMSPKKNAAAEGRGDQGKGMGGTSRGLTRVRRICSGCCCLLSIQHFRHAFSGLFTGHDPAHGSGWELSKLSRVESGLVRSTSQYHGWERIGSGGGLQISFFFLFSSFFFTHFYFPASGQAVVTGVVPSPPRFLPSIFSAHRV